MLVVVPKQAKEPTKSYNVKEFFSYSLYPPLLCVWLDIIVPSLSFPPTAGAGTSPRKEEPKRQHHLGFNLNRKKIFAQMMEQKQNSSDKIFTSPLHPPGVSFYHSLFGVRTPPTVRMKSDVFEVDFENHFQI